MIKIGADEVHIWLLPSHKENIQNLMLKFGELLDDEELKHLQCLKRTKDKCLFLLTRALIRNALSFYVKHSPKIWQFTKTKYGQPLLVKNQCSLEIQFNLSRTDNLVAGIITLENKVGIDIETTNQKSDMPKLIEQYLSNTEKEKLRLHDEIQNIEILIKYWTLKEAYLKAQGVGLLYPPTKISFNLNDKKISIVKTMPNDSPSNWTFYSMKVSPKHILSVAISRTKRKKKINYPKICIGYLTQNMEISSFFRQ